MADWPDLVRALEADEGIDLDAEGLAVETLHLGRQLVSQGRWGEAARAFALLREADPRSVSYGALVEQGLQLDVLKGEELSRGLGPLSYRHWLDHAEPPLPDPLLPLHQAWWLPRGEEVWRALHGAGISVRCAPQQGWLVLAGPGVRLRQGALQALEAWLRRCTPDLAPQMVYTDEDRLAADGSRFDPWFKPDWVPESFWSTPWLESLSCWSVPWLRDQGLPPPSASSDERFGWILEALERQPRIGHVPQVLAHVEMRDPLSSRSEQRAAQLARHLGHLGESDVRVEPHRVHPGAFRLSWPCPRPLSCRVIVPTKDKPELLGPCLEGLAAAMAIAAAEVRTEVVVVDNGSKQAATRDLLESWQARLGEAFQVHRDQRPFNWSALNNTVAASASTDLLLFLNNDTRPTADSWLVRLATQAMRPAVGCAGALLLFEHGTVQHAGILLGRQQMACHAYRDFAPDHPVHRGRLQCLTGWGGVTGACLMVRRELFERVGGFDEALPVEGNDVEFCLRLGALGYRHVVDPEICFPHYESRSRPRRKSPTVWAAVELLRARWGERLNTASPWWPPACSPDHTDGRPLGLEHLI